MIAFLEGSLEEKQPARVMLNVHGVGYEVFIPLSSYDRLPKPGETCRLLIYEVIREDSYALFGFSSADERDIFQKLMSISGIGPKLALSALSSLSVRELKRAVVEGDAKRLSSISGVGKKMAERMIVELRDKFSTGETLEAVAGTGTGEAEAPSDARLADVVSALVTLGYNREDAQKMLRKTLPNIKPAMMVDEIIRMTLQR